MYDIGERLAWLTFKQHIQEDFVRQRQEDPSITADDLVHLMKVARCGDSH
jgi:hypothetical protein